MYKLIIAFFALTLAFGCNDAARPVAQSNTPAASSTPDKSQTAIAHSSENKAQTAPAPPSGGGKWSASGDPIDTAKFDDAIAKAEKGASAKPNDTGAKKALATAYYERAVALTDARQYASALGDYRKAVKNDPSNTDAKEWIDKITMIYDSMGKQSPKEGEEPPPLPMKKT